MKHSLLFILCISLSVFFNSCEPGPDPIPTATPTPPPLTFTEFQVIDTYAAFDWEYFSIEDAHFIAVANHWDGSNYTLNSKIYKWNGSTFSFYQNIGPFSALDLEYFTIEGEHYLAVANYRNVSSYDVPSVIYHWEPETQLFAVYGNPISTHGARNWEYFSIDDNHYLVVANSTKNDSADTDSVIFKWNGVDGFISYQDILTHGATDWEYFTIGEDSYLAVANYSSTAESYYSPSCIYKWDTGTEKFIEIAIDKIPTIGAMSLESFSINGESYLAAANCYSGSTYNIKSRVYKWDNDDMKFKEVSFLDTHGAYDWEYLSISDDHYLIVANLKNDELYTIDSKLYKWDRENDTFLEDKSIPTAGATDWEYFTIGEEHFLAVANANNGSSYNVGSVIYKVLF